MGDGVDAGMDAPSAFLARWPFTQILCEDIWLDHIAVEGGGGVLKTRFGVVPEDLGDCFPLESKTRSGALFSSG